MSAIALRISSIFFSTSNISCWSWKLNIYNIFSSNFKRKKRLRGLRNCFFEDTLCRCCWRLFFASNISEILQERALFVVLQASQMSWAVRFSRDSASLRNWRESARSVWDAWMILLAAIAQVSCSEVLKKHWFLKQNQMEN